MENINMFDIVVSALIVVLGLKGLFRGFTKEFFALVGIVGGVFVASRVAKDAGGIVNSIIPMQNENTILLAGFIASLVVVWIVAYIAGTILEKIFTLSGLGFLDKILGFVFGASKIFLLFAIISYAVSSVKTINDNLQPKLKDSILFPILKDAGGYIIKLDTSGIQKKVTKQLDDVTQKTKEKLQEISKEELAKKAQEIKKELQERPNDK